jgi:hypothetical protein
MRRLLKTCHATAASTSMLQEVAKTATKNLGVTMEQATHA